MARHRLKKADLRKAERAEVTRRAEARPDRGAPRTREAESRIERPAVERRREPATEPHRRRGGVPWWVWLLGLLAVGILILMIVSSSTDEDSTRSGGATDSAAQTAGTGTLSADGADLMEAAAQGGLAQYEGRDVEGRSVTVESVVSDEGFWVGTSSAERVFVWLAIEGESGPDIDAGDRVDVSGSVRALPAGFEETFGVAPAEGADELAELGSYVEVTALETA